MPVRLHPFEADAPAAGKEITKTDYPQNYAEAAKWYRRAAEQGMADSQVNLGIMYYHGQGVSRDYVLAHMWLTPAQIAKAERLAREWNPKKGR